VTYSGSGFTDDEHARQAADGGRRDSGFAEEDALYVFRQVGRRRSSG
jgi:hypothetical protein